MFTCGNHDYMEKIITVYRKKTCDVDLKQLISIFILSMDHITV